MKKCYIQECCSQNQVVSEDSWCLCGHEHVCIFGSIQAFALQLAASHACVAQAFLGAFYINARRLLQQPPEKGRRKKTSAEMESIVTRDMNIDPFTTFLDEDVWTRSPTTWTCQDLTIFPAFLFPLYATGLSGPPYISLIYLREG